MRLNNIQRQQKQQAFSAQARFAPKIKITSKMSELLKQYGTDADSVHIDCPSIKMWADDYGWSKDRVYSDTLLKDNWMAFRVYNKTENEEHQFFLHDFIGDSDAVRRLKADNTNGTIEKVTERFLEWLVSGAKSLTNNKNL